MTISRSRLAGLLVAGVAAVALVAVAPAQSAAADHGDKQYVAVGDSFSAGVGTVAAAVAAGGTVDPPCLRSPYGYPELVAQRAGWKVDNQACAGAKAAELLDPKNPQHLQLDSLSDDTDYVTIGIGGNDIGFMPVVGACGLPEPKPCDDALDGARTALSSLGDSLEGCTAKSR